MRIAITDNNRPKPYFDNYINWIHSVDPSVAFVKLSYHLNNAEALKETDPLLLTDLRLGYVLHSSEDIEEHRHKVPHTLLGRHRQRLARRQFDPSPGDRYTRTRLDGLSNIARWCHRGGRMGTQRPHAVSPRRAMASGADEGCGQSSCAGDRGIFFKRSSQLSIVLRQIFDNGMSICRTHYSLL